MHSNSLNLCISAPALRSTDRQLTHNDLYSLDIHKLDEREVIIEDDIKPLEESDDDSEDDSDEDGMATMDTS